MFIPAFRRAPSISTVLVLGPMVAMIELQSARGELVSLTEVEYE